MQNDLNKYQIAQLIYKSISKILTLEDKLIFEVWLQQEGNYELYHKIINKENIQEKLSIYHQIDIDKIYQKLEKKMSENKKRPIKLRYLKLLKYAAIVILFLSIGYFYQNGYFTKENSPELVIPNESITLELGNGDIEVITKGGFAKVTDSEGNLLGTQRGNQLVYLNKVNKDSLVFNTLTVPYGKRFQLVLSDGSKIHLNSGTSLKYPVKFIEGENRQVFLDGEAYFSITKDAKHPFIVNTDKIDVRVLGTQFNISSYPEDSNINTVLVEGKVAIYNMDNIYNPKTAIMLTPGFKASWEKIDNKISVEEVDIEMYTAWIEGKIIFRHLSFKNILKKLERHYNVTIIIDNKKLSEEFFTASFDIETIYEVFEALNTSHNIEYTISNNQIIIN